MKKTIIVLFLFLVGLNFVFADESGLVPDAGSLPSDKSTTLTLKLDGDAYLVGFSESESSFTHKDTITLSESIDVDEMTVGLERKEFYFFYKAITDASVSFMIAVTPLSLVETEEVTEATEDKKKIHYTATITKIDNKWNGADVTPSALNTSGTSGTATVTNPCMLKGSSFTNYLATGIAKVVITSDEDLGEKVPGTYSGTITVTLQSGS